MDQLSHLPKILPTTSIQNFKLYFRRTLPFYDILRMFDCVAKMDVDSEPTAQLQAQHLQKEVLQLGYGESRLTNDELKKKNSKGILFRFNCRGTRHEDLPGFSKETEACSHHTVDHHRLIPNTYTLLCMNKSICLKKQQ